MNLVGFFLTLFAGLLCGLAPAPLKWVRRFEYEHWGLILGIFGYLVFPWTFVLATCPDTFAALSELPLKTLLVGNAFSCAWGVANILYFICMIKIGFCLAQGILVGIAIPAGVLIPMIMKGSGTFSNAPDIMSRTGLFIVLTVLIMLVAVVLLSKAGFGRERALASAGEAKQTEKTGRGLFLTYLVMGILAGLLSVGISFSFVYTEDVIKDVFAAHGMSRNLTPAAVRAVTISGGGILNVLYPLYLLHKNRSWHRFAEQGALKDSLCGLAIALATTVSVVMTTAGQIMLGALGSSVGFGIGQSMQLLGSQCLGFAYGEWKGVPKKYTSMVLAAMALLLVSVGIISLLQN